MISVTQLCCGYCHILLVHSSQNLQPSANFDADLCLDCLTAQGLSPLLYISTAFSLSLRESEVRALVGSL